MNLTTGNIKKAYLYLKSYAYHENLNLFLKQRIAEFEVKSADLDKIFHNISRITNAENPHKTKEFSALLKSIDYHLLPKLVERNEDHNQYEHNKERGLFISNVRDANKYQVSKVNYFINAPVEIHIIEILWCIFVGPVLESKMSKDCYGNRMHPSALKYATNIEEANGQEIFKRYIDQYNLWRDQAINVATEISKNDDDVALLSLDLKSYFYHVDLKFEEIVEEINGHFVEAEDKAKLALKLNLLLEYIYTRYHSVIASRIKQTHVKCKEKNGLPIGLASSSIIANWYLSKFDVCIGENVRPAYYGRYVDDIIMVFKRPKFDVENPIQSFVNHYLEQALIVKGGEAEYSIEVGNNSLPIQKDKLILQFYDKEHSRAGLEVFKQELEDRSSAFKFLPSDHIDNELEKFAYDILYDGSANKLRSVVGLAENETELAKYLSSHITAHRLCKLDKKDTVLPQLKHFFKGQNALQFFRLWEKLYQYAVITQSQRFSNQFFQYIESEISKIDGVMPNSKKISKQMSEKLQNDLRLFNQLSLSVTLGLLDVINPYLKSLSASIIKSERTFSTKRDELEKVAICGSEIHFYAWQFRQANLIRHQLVAWPLANFSDFDGDLTNELDIENNQDIRLDTEKVELSPRFIHFDEWQLFHIAESLDTGGGLNNWISESIEGYKDQFLGQDFSANFKSADKNSDGIIKSELNVGGEEAKGEITLAVANLEVSETDIALAVRKDRKPNISFSRQEKLYSILNSALKEKADLLVMPEVAIPVSWLPFMVSFSRRNQIGLIFGLEHWVINDVAYNLIIEALPFKVCGKYKSCFVTARIKNHYAPAELDLLESIRLQPGNLSMKPNAYYHKVSWRGISFATYNCFELSDITHRILFKSEIDLLFACVWNKDTNYYQHIIESAVRDLHCYTVQANTSQYGGSCVLRPTKTESKTMLYVKGGENSCVLTTKLDIKALRDFQYKSRPETKDYFKHLPPGYDSDSVLKR
jgi:hypothetical protein